MDIIADKWAVVVAENIMLVHDADMTSRKPDEFREDLAKLFQQAYESGRNGKILDISSVESWTR